MLIVLPWRPFIPYREGEGEGDREREVAIMGPRVMERVRGLLAARVRAVMGLWWYSGGRACFEQARGVLTRQSNRRCSRQGRAGRFPDRLAGTRLFSKQAETGGCFQARKWDGSKQACRARRSRPPFAPGGGRQPRYQPCVEDNG